MTRRIVVAHGRRRRYLPLAARVVLPTALPLMTGASHADSLERLDRLEEENRELRTEIDALKAVPESKSPAAPFVRVDPEYGYAILDPTTNINRKQRVILERKRDRTLASDPLHVQDEWPGTFNPDIPEFRASRVTSFDVGARRRFDTVRGPVDLSAEFSRFVAGPHGAPWERQDQIVLGAAWFARPSAKLFMEYIRVDGFVPLNFVSGGSVRDERGEVIPNRTISDRSAHSDIVMVGVNVAF